MFYFVHAVFSCVACKPHLLGGTVFFGSFRGFGQGLVTPATKTTFFECVHMAFEKLAKSSFVSRQVGRSQGESGRNSNHPQAPQSKESPPPLRKHRLDQAREHVGPSFFWLFLTVAFCGQKFNASVLLCCDCRAKGGWIMLLVVPPAFRLQLQPDATCFDVIFSNA